jgi:hypothetical protein
VYTGVLTVTAYGGILGVTVANPRIVESSDGPVLVVDTLDASAPVLRVASLRVVEPAPPGVIEYEAALLDTGRAWLGDAYAVGTTLDRVTVV